MTSYLEQLQHDPALRAFVDAQRGHDAVELAALKVEFQHQVDAIAAQQRRITELEQQLKKRKAGDR